MSATADHEPGVYDESCGCDECYAERARRLAVLMFAWMLPPPLATLYREP